MSRGEIAEPMKRTFAICREAGVPTIWAGAIAALPVVALVVFWAATAFLVESIQRIVHGGCP